MHVEIRRLAAEQDALVEWTQMLALGLSEKVVMRAMRDERHMHSGVWLVGPLPPTARQRWRAATMTTPHTVLNHASAAALRGLRPHRGAFETVTRPGQGGPQRIGELLVTYSLRFSGEWKLVDGIPVMRAPRVIIDLAPFVGPRELHKMLREALRTSQSTVDALRAARRSYAGRRGVGALAKWLDLYGTLPFERCKSDAEARGLEVLREARIAIPEVNVVVEGLEADYVWRDRRKILEIDGPQWHRDKRLDALKTRTWRGAGWSVDRVPSDAVFDDPARVVEAARR